MSSYKLNILKMNRELPILKTPSGIQIAGFNSVGDMQLLIKAGKYLSKKIKRNSFDIILTTELKGVPIAQEVARRLKCNYVCLRKEKKCYMANPIHTSGESITSGKSDYYISENELNKIKNKRVIFVDDVVSTGNTFNHMIDFSNDYHFKLVGALSILREGKENTDDTILNFDYKGIPVFCCAFLPLPEKE